MGIVFSIFITKDSYDYNIKNNEIKEKTVERIDMAKYCENKIDIKNSLSKSNSRSNHIKTTFQKYAPDINYTFDTETVKKNLSEFIQTSSLTGFTSCVSFFEYNDLKIVEKKYKNVDKNSRYYTDSTFIQESFSNELEALTMLQNEYHFPHIITYSTDNKSIITTYAGKMLGNKLTDIDLNTIPNNWKYQFHNILMTLKKYNLYHNDITERNICLKDGVLYLIDFGNCKKHIDLYYRNFYLDMLYNSKNIVEFLDKINKNAIEIRKCSHGFIPI